MIGYHAQVICHKTGVIDLLLVSRFRFYFFLSFGLGERMSLHFWFFCWIFSLSYVIKVDVRECLVQCFQQWADWSNWEDVILHCWFSANGRFLKVREGHFALLIPSKWKISQRICTDHKVSATHLINFYNVQKLLISAMYNVMICRARIFV